MNKNITLNIEKEMKASICRSRGQLHNVTNIHTGWAYKKKTGRANYFKVTL